MIRTIKDNKYLYLIWLSCLLCITLSVVISNALSFVAFLILAVGIIFLPTSKSVVLMIAIMPFANIFKLSNNSTSLFTICEILLILILFLKNIKIKYTFIVSLIVLVGYLFLTSINNLNLVIILKVIVGFLVLSFSIKVIQKNDVKNIAYMLSTSIIAMLLLSNNEDFFTYLKPYLNDLNYYVDSSGNFSGVMRSGGFLGDPNYCSMMIICVISLLCVLYYHKSIGNEFWLFFLFLVPLGFLTYSKSYLLCLIALIIFLLLFVLFPKHKVISVIAVISIVIVTILAASGKIDAFNMIMDRFSAGDITTGRSELNKDYLEYIFSNEKNVFLGAGISSDRYLGANNNVHNLYIELWYKLGLVGSAIYFITIIILFYKPNSRKQMKLIDLLPVLFVVVMYFFLAGSLRYELPFYLIICYASLYYGSLATDGKSCK